MCPLPNFFYQKVKEEEMGGACGTHGEKENTWRIFMGNLDILLLYNRFYYKERHGGELKEAILDINLTTDMISLM
jgi:hypothetical protein